LLNNLAWVLATSPNDNLRDGKRAIELAKQGCDLTEYKQAHIVSTLAAAYAETGDFESAIKWSKKAVETGSEAIKPQLAKELESYEAKKPWREEKPPEVQAEDDATVAAPDAPSEKPASDSPQADDKASDEKSEDDSPNDSADDKPSSRDESSDEGPSFDLPLDTSDGAQR
jgi:hypothetical protein